MAKAIAVDAATLPESPAAQASKPKREIEGAAVTGGVVWATRDASGLPCPDIYCDVRFHVVDPDNHGFPLCGLENVWLSDQFYTTAFIDEFYRDGKCRRCLRSLEKRRVEDARTWGDAVPEMPADDLRGLRGDGTS